MKSIYVYDVEAKQLERIADENDTSIAEIVEMLCQYIPEMADENGLKH